MEDEGIVFLTSVHIGIDILLKELVDDFDAIVLCGGSEKPRDIPIEGRDLDGIHFAMNFLPQQNKRNEGDVISKDISIEAKGKNVLIIGGGDTGSDCLGTSLRQGAKNIYQFELLPQPPEERKLTNPWPEWPMIMRVSSSHEEAKSEIRKFSVSTKKFSGSDGKIKKVHAVEVKFGDPDPETGRTPLIEIPESKFELDVDLVLLAMGFVHPIHEGMVSELAVKLDDRGNVWCDENKMTSVDSVFVAGDMARGQSLVVWAIAEGREAARGVDKYLMSRTNLPHSQFLK
jgi:glutamate synthase (NADPH/NADH) small chain